MSRTVATRRERPVRPPKMSPWGYRVVRRAGHCRAGRQRASLDPWRPVKRVRRCPRWPGACRRGSRTPVPTSSTPWSRTCTTSSTATRSGTSSRCWSRGRPCARLDPLDGSEVTRPRLKPPERGVHRLFTSSDHTDGVRTDPDMQSRPGGRGAAARPGPRPAPRTLIDVFDEVVEAVPDARASGQRGRAAHLPGVRRRGRRVWRPSSTPPGSAGATGSGVRVKSGTTDLYVAIMGVLVSGAAYVPVDAEDPDDRARLVFDEAAVAAVVGNDLAVALRRPGLGPPHRRGTHPGRRRVGDLHLGLDRHPQGGRRLAPVRGRLRRRRVADVPPGPARSAAATG